MPQVISFLTLHVVSHAWSDARVVSFPISFGVIHDSLGATSMATINGPLNNWLSKLFLFLFPFRLF